MKYIVALDKMKPYIFLADGNGDPARTCLQQNAKRFDRIGDAYIALGNAMNRYPNRNFERAKVIKVET